MVNERRTGLKGFTVVELIVAMSVSAVILLSGYELFQALKGVSDSQSVDMAAMAEIVHSLDRMREDLLHALPRTGSKEPIFAGSDPAVDESAEPARLLEFYSLCTGGSGDSYFHGLRQMQQIRYELITAAGSLRLYRSATPVTGAGRMSGDESRELVLDHIDQVKIAFHNGGTLEPRFSSNEKLPVGVDLAVTACSRVWPLSVRLPCGSSGGRH